MELDIKRIFYEFIPTSKSGELFYKHFFAIGNYVAVYSWGYDIAEDKNAPDIDGITDQFFRSSFLFCITNLEYYLTEYLIEKVGVCNKTELISLIQQQVNPGKISFQSIKSIVKYYNQLLRIDLTQLEKYDMILLIMQIRHNLIHNFGNFDQDFILNIKELGLDLQPYQNFYFDEEFYSLLVESIKDFIQAIEDIEIP